MPQILPPIGGVLERGIFFGRTFQTDSEVHSILLAVETRSASEVAKSLPHLRFGLVWIGTISTADSIHYHSLFPPRQTCIDMREDFRVHTLRRILVLR